MSGSGDNKPDSQWAQDPQASLQRQNERLQLLLNLTSRITSNLDLREVLRAISANFREVMRCDGAGIWLPGEEVGMFKLYAFDAPVSMGFAKEEVIITLPEDDPARRAFETMMPMVATVDEIGWPGGGEGFRLAAAENVKSACFIPLVNRDRALGDLMIVRLTEESFTAEDVDFLSQAAGQIAIALENALAYREISELKDKLAQEKLYLEQEIRSEMDFEQIVGSSAELKHVLQLVETVAPNDSTVLLLGETGIGKELIARAIHDRSRRRERTLVKLNCAAIPTGLLESELFGHEKSAFTGAISQKIGRMELADQGTLFLDEVGDIPTDIQPKLLRALQEREFERLGSTHTRRVNIRLIAATNRDLEKMVANREFRSDLYYRLNVFPIRIPPLRERREDIPLLVSYFVQKFAQEMQKKIGTIPTAMMRGLLAASSSAIIPLPIDEARSIRGLLLLSSAPYAAIDPWCRGRCGVDRNHQRQPARASRALNSMRTGPRQPPNERSRRPPTAAHPSAMCWQKPARFCISIRPTTASLDHTVTKGWSWSSWSTVIAG